MIRHLPWTVLLAAALTLAACGGGGGSGGSTWSPDSGMLSDEGTAAMVSVPAGDAKVGVRNPTIAKTVRSNSRATTLFRTRKMNGFQIDKYEVTNHNYYLFLQTLTADQRKQFRPRHHILKVAHPHWTSKHYKSGTGDYPVTGITYEAAEAYAQWRGKRLPDEFEWEYAARGKQGYMYGASSDSYQPRNLNVSDHWKSSPDLVAVNAEPNSLDISPFGCVGMGGNASEWCSTTEVREYNVRSKETGEIIKGERQKFRLKAFRGPNFQSAGDLQCLLSFQGYKDPKSNKREEHFEITIGFRCAK